MVDEKEGHYEEEGEYHFSDDQLNYDVEPEPSKATSTSAFTKEALLQKLSQHRRKILGVVSFFILIGVVYKILVPTSTAPATEFNQAAPAKAIKPTAVTKTKSTTVSQSVTTPVSSPSVAQPPAMENNPIAPSPSIPQTQSPAATMNPAPITEQPSSTQQPSASVGMPSTAPMNPGAQPMPSPAVPVMNPTSAVQTSADVQTKDRVTALEQQNTAMMNLLQTEYAQKIADTETQVNAVHGKMEELTKRVNRIETSLNQITQLLQGISKSQASNVMGSVPSMNTARSAEPKMIYSVQAIIPGRAWLKSESGDTVTVAEGDYLKKYGRVTKIDPYDGVVAIDTGNKIITLSYGLDGE